MGAGQQNKKVKKTFFQKSDFDLIKNSSLDEMKKLSLISEMIRYNTLTEVMIANSGHLGASLSAIDTFVALYYRILRIKPENPSWPERDIFILSKGHACSALYATLASLGYFSENLLFKFRRLDGLEGHADIAHPGVEANTGSLGMGISKAKGHALALKKKGLKSRVFVMVGDGELQEGQNWEGLQSAPAFKLGNLVLLVDKNAVQTDKKVNELLPMPPIKEKLRSFGWQVLEIDGHKIEEIVSTLSSLSYEDETPKAIILNTIKGKGVSFLEHPQDLKKEGVYHWHGKVPNEEEYQLAIKEIRERIKNLLDGLELKEDFLPEIPSHFKRISIPWTKESVVEGFSRGLLNLAEKRKDILVLDADLAADCGLKSFEEKYPERFIEVGIAEQDMVSMAGALARQGFLPIVNTFAVFLCSRANEQIFNNQTEGKKIIYIGHLAGLIPATPGKSHQSLRDIALMKTMPNLVLAEPCNAFEAENLFKFLVQNLRQGAYFRLVNCRGIGEISLPKDYKVSLGRGVILREGKEIALISYGPIILPQALLAAEKLAKDGISLKVINLPWLNVVDKDWFLKVTRGIRYLFTVDNHDVFGGLGDTLAKLILEERLLIKFYPIGIEGLAKTGNVLEILKYYGLDAKSLINKIKEKINEKKN